jgi:metal-dependent amidase/aminoacylase/carboxypeptidase family protein
MPIINRIAEFHREMTEWRQDLHAHPELALQETRTSGVVQAKLKEFGVDEIITGLARTGVVGVIRGNGTSERAIGPTCRHGCAADPGRDGRLLHLAERGHHACLWP